MSFYFSPTNKNRLKDLRKSFSENISSAKTTTSSARRNAAFELTSLTKPSKELENRTERAANDENSRQLILKAETRNCKLFSGTVNDVADHHHHYLNSSNIESHNTKLERKTSSGGSFAMMPSVKSRLIKNISRTKEKILQGMGKNDKTSDENFDLYVENFEHQYTQANKLHKELNKYLSSLKETHKSSRAFYETLKETYESQWPMSNQFAEQIDQMELRWSEYLTRLYKDVQLPLMSYLNEFPELKKKIEKRCNRLLDYDNARHSLESAQSKSMKKNILNLNSIGGVGGLTNNNNNNNCSSSSSSSSNSGHANTTITSTSTTTTSTTATDQLTKLTKLKIDLEDKQHVYEEINQTLCLALPVLFENRVKFYASLLQTFFHTETIFHSESVESKTKLDELCENLSLKSSTVDTLTGTNHFKMLSNKLNSLHIDSFNTDAFDNSNTSVEPITNDDDESPNKTNGVESMSNNADPPIAEAEHEPEPEADLNEHHVAEFVPKNNLNEQSCYSSSEDLSTGGNMDQHHQQQLPPTMDDSSNYHHKRPSLEQEPPRIMALGGNEAKVPPSRDRIVYRVKATYPYEAKELDELTFTKEDVILVVEGTESEKEDLDDGWLIGIHENSSRRGLFPENFTKRIS